jgi:hypothetical protein
LAAAASPASAFASTVFIVTCAFGDAAVDEGGEGGCRSCQEGNRRQTSPIAHPPPAHRREEGYAVSRDACVSVFPCFLARTSPHSDASLVREMSKWCGKINCRFF